MKAWIILLMGGIAAAALTACGDEDVPLAEQEPIIYELSEDAAGCMGTWSYVRVYEAADFCADRGEPIGYSCIPRRPGIAGHAVTCGATADGRYIAEASNNAALFYQSPFVAECPDRYRPCEEAAAE